MASPIGELIELLSAAMVTKLGQAEDIKFKRGMTRRERVARTYAARHGKKGALSRALEVLSETEIKDAFEAMVFSFDRDSDDTQLEYEAVALDRMRDGEVKKLAKLYCTDQDDLSRISLLSETYGDFFDERVVDDLDDDDDDDNDLDDDDDDLDDDGDDLDNDGAFDDDEDIDDDSEDDDDGRDEAFDDGEDIERHIDDLDVILADLRLEPENTIRGYVWCLPEVPNSDPQPLMRHQDATILAIENNGGASGIVHLPTGAGKTRVALELMARHLARSPSARVVWVTRNTTLIRQSMIRLVELLAIFPREVNMLWLLDAEQAKDPDLFDYANVVYTTEAVFREWLRVAADKRSKREPLRTALTSRAGDAREILVIHDECHQLGASKLQQGWRRFHDRVLNTERARNRFRIIGLSATPMPTDPRAHRLLRERVFPMVEGARTTQDWGVLVHHSESMASLTREKILCPMNLKLQGTGIFDVPDKLLDRVANEVMANFPRRKPAKKTDRQWAKEFSARFNRDVMSHPDILGHLADRLAEHQAVLGKTIVFCATISAANTLVAALLADARVGAGNVTVVHSKMEDPEVETFEEDLDEEFTRKEVQIQEFIDRRSRPCIMVNVGMLTTGFDDPLIRSVVLARLTFSKNLFWQMLGRGLRGPHAGGTADCYVIDPVRLTDRFEVFRGYRPDLALRGIPETDLEPPNPLHDPEAQAPEVLDTEIPPEPDTPMDRAIRASVQEALHAFLAGEEFDVETVVAGVEEVQVEGVGAEQRIVAADTGASDGSVVALFHTGIHGVETFLGQELPWLYGLMPTVLSEDARRVFLYKLKVVRARRILTLDEWHAYEATMYGAGPA